MFVELKVYALFDGEMIEKLSNYFENVSKPFPKTIRSISTRLGAKYTYEKGIHRGTNTGDKSKI